MGTSLVVQWLRICASTAGGMGSIPGWGTKIPHAAQSSQKQTKKKIIHYDYKNKLLGNYIFRKE